MIKKWLSKDIFVCLKDKFYEVIDIEFLEVIQIYWCVRNSHHIFIKQWMKTYVVSYTIPFLDGTYFLRNWLISIWIISWWHKTFILNANLLNTREYYSLLTEQVISDTEIKIQCDSCHFMWYESIFVGSWWPVKSYCHEFHETCHSIAFYFKKN